jgi:DNA-binding MarR family transcriptional regulator
MKMAEKQRTTSIYGELTELFFETRQIIKQKVPGTGHADPNAWMRLQTMQYIDRNGSVTMHDIATYLRIKAPSATSLIAHLVARDMIAREIGRDRRVVRLSLTPLGKKTVKKYGTTSEQMMRSTFSTLEEAEVGSLCSILKKLIRGHAGPKSA